MPATNVKLTKSITVWKVLKWYNNSQYVTRRVVAKLTVPAGAYLYSQDPSEMGSDTKMRASMAIVEGIFDRDGEEVTDPIILGLVGSAFDKPDLGYARSKGLLVFPDKFDFGTKQCSHGIHCFATAEQAFVYQL